MLLYFIFNVCRIKVIFSGNKLPKCQGLTKIPSPQSLDTFTHSKGDGNKVTSFKQVHIKLYFRPTLHPNQFAIYVLNQWTYFSTKVHLSKDVQVNIDSVGPADGTYNQQCSLKNNRCHLQAPVILTKKRSAPMATWVVLLSTLPGTTGGTLWHREDKKGMGLQRPEWVWVVLWLALNFSFHALLLTLCSM